jgi:CheY-like chemotaxis protein
VLLAEDNPVNQEVAVNMLEELGCRVEVAASGREVLDRLSQKTYDLVLMDCQMPELDGFEATRLIRQREQIEKPIGDAPDKTMTRVPIIALTANTLQGDRERCLDAGMDDFLSKPFSLEQMGNIVEPWLRKKLRLPGPAQASAQIVPVSPPAGQTNESGPTPMGPKIIDREALDNIRTLQRPDAPDLVGKVINKYLSASTILLQGLRDAVSAGDAPAVQKVAHTLKSSSANVGATRLAAQCKELELEARINRLGPGRDQLRELEAEYQAVRAALEAELPQSL